MGNRRILLSARPAGIPQASDFTQDEAPIPTPGPGQFVVRNLFLSVDPAQRGWATTGTPYAPAVPLGSVMRALAVGTVVASGVADFPEGTHVYGWFGWQDYALATAADVLTRIGDTDLPLSAYAGVLGINGLTAYLALNRIGRPAQGETIVVTTAAGAVGSIVGQLARTAGCEVVGVTGTKAKVALCVERFGYHRAISYRDGPFSELLAAAIPDGADILFDNVGGEMLDAALRQLRIGGRVVQCGTASVSSWSPPPTGLRNEREILLRRLTWGGFILFDHLSLFEDGIRALSELIRQGALYFEEDIRPGIASAPQALNDVYMGRNQGKMLVATS